MEKINWKQKLTSRKFWAAIIAVIVAICAIFGIPEMTTEQVTTLVMAFGTLIAYILGEGFVDAKRVEAENNTTSEGISFEVGTDDEE